MTLRAVRRFVVPGAILDETVDVLQRAGRRRAEAFVAWAGRHDASDAETFAFSNVLVPDQTARTTRDGLLVSIDADALFVLNRELYRRGRVLAGQAHSHPGRAYHSKADDALAFVTMPGGLSVVVPDFARDGRPALRRWAWYRLSATGVWSPLRDAEITIT
jgi:hypothetical protein